MSQNAISARDALVAAGRERLLTDGIEGLRALLNASVLSRKVPVSRDTAYRVFREGPAGGDAVADAVVMAVAESAHDVVWAGTAAAQAEAFAAYADNVHAGNDAGTTAVDVLRVAFEAQFRSPGLAAAWLLQAAALPASDAWGCERPTGDALELGRRILALRRESARTTEDQLAGFFTMAVSELGRRPRRGTDPRTIVMLVRCLLDGAVLHRLLDPDSITPDLAAEAMYLLGLAFTEAGSADDPRRPEGDGDQELFDRLLEAAAGLWRSRPGITVEDAAAATGTPVAAALGLFPDVGDLADSLLRAGVIAGGFVDLGPFPDAARAQQHLPALAAELRRLRDLADTTPHLVTATHVHHPTRSKAFADEFVESESRILRALDVQHPEQLARDLVGFAAQGRSGWPAVMALLRTVGYDPELPRDTA